MLPVFPVNPSASASEISSLVIPSTTPIVDVAIGNVEWLRVLHVKESVKHFFALQRTRLPFEFCRMQQHSWFIYSQEGHFDVLRFFKKLKLENFFSIH